MIIKQISIFLEDKKGELSRLIRLLADHHINLEAFSIAESRDYGVLRVIADKPEETAALLREENWAYTQNEVLAVNVPDTPGSLTEILTTLADGGVSLAYSYAFLSRTQGQACIVLRVSNNAAAQELLAAKGI